MEGLGCKNLDWEWTENGNPTMPSLELRTAMPLTGDQAEQQAEEISLGWNTWGLAVPAEHLTEDMSREWPQLQQLGRKA